VQVAVVGLVIIVLVAVAYYVGVGFLARARNRWVLGWVLLALVTGPFAAIALFVMPRRDDPMLSGGVPISPAVCPECGSGVDTVTGAGLVSPPDEPWLLLCAQCRHEIPAET
jgi:hypothetical protein